MSLLSEITSTTGSIVVKAEEDLSPAGIVRASRTGEVIKDVAQTLDSTLTPIAKALRERLHQAKPQQVAVAFGLKFRAGTGVIVSRVAAEAAIEIELTWSQTGA